jgi:hypothetical protein
MLNIPRSNAGHVEYLGQRCKSLINATTNRSATE